MDMKIFLQKCLCVILAVLLLNIQSFAIHLKGSETLSQSEKEAIRGFNETEIYGAFDELAPLEQSLQSEDSGNYADILSTNSELVANVSASSVLPLSDGGPVELALGIPSFFWGCGFGLVGVVIEIGRAHV